MNDDVKQLLERWLDANEIPAEKRPSWVAAYNALQQAVALPIDALDGDSSQFDEFICLPTTRSVEMGEWLRMIAVFCEIGDSTGSSFHDV